VQKYAGHQGAVLSVTQRIDLRRDNVRMVGNGEIIIAHQHDGMFARLLAAHDMAAAPLALPTLDAKGVHALASQVNERCFGGRNSGTRKYYCHDGYSAGQDD